MRISEEEHVLPKLALVYPGHFEKASTVSTKMHFSPEMFQFCVELTIDIERENMKKKKASKFRKVCELRKLITRNKSHPFLEIN